MIDFLEGKLSIHQHGFMKNKSCLSNLLETFDSIINLLEEGASVDIFYFDFKKAFDRVPHNRLIYKLKCLGIDGNLLDVIKDFFTSRTLRVSVEGKLSSIKDVFVWYSTRVSFGPLLFSIFINDLPDYVKSRVTIFSDDLKLIGNASDRNYTDKEISDIEISSYEVETLLKEINIYKSEGPDKIHPKLLKSLCDNTNFVDAVTKLFRKCYETGCLPDVWKTAKITALYKKGSKCEAKNYRPISLTCILCKVFEKIIRNHILKHFEPFVHSSQHGFLSGKSCLSNLLNCFEKVDELLENNDNVDIIYLDFQKAFDSVPHKRLMHKLKMYGITAKTLAIISDFLKDRTFCVRIGDKLSNKFYVLSGVPQGSVLGPLLFLIFINDIPEGIKSFLLLFADDLKLVINANFPQIVQNDLDILSQWQKKWLIDFNTADNKCKVLEVMNKGRKVSNTYILNKMVLPITNCEKDLGINVVSELKWNYHIEQNISKAKKCIGWVTRSVISREADVMINIYKSLVRPNLEYCVQLWNPIPKHGNWALIMELESVQRRFTRLVDGIGLLPYKDRLNKLRITTLIERRARGDIIELFKIFRGLCSYGSSLFKFSRSGMNIVLTKNASNMNTFQMRVAKYWNRIPDDVKLSADVDKFKIKLENYKKERFEVKGNYWELSDGIFDRINDENRQSYVDFMIKNPFIAKRKFVNVNA